MGKLHLFIFLFFAFKNKIKLAGPNNWCSPLNTVSLTSLIAVANEGSQGRRKQGAHTPAQLVDY